MGHGGFKGVRLGDSLAVAPYQQRAAPARSGRFRRFGGRRIEGCGSPRLAPDGCHGAYAATDLGELNAHESVPLLIVRCLLSGAYRPVPIVRCLWSVAVVPRKVSFWVLFMVMFVFMVMGALTGRLVEFGGREGRGLGLGVRLLNVLGPVGP